MPSDSYQKSLVCARVALAKKAFDPVILQVAGITTLADYFVIVSAASSRQVQTIAQAIEAELAGQGFTPMGIEGFSEGRWALLDYNDVVVHVFLKPVREFYDLERLWFEANRIEEKEVLSTSSP
jgi:ribosome-associated protein